MKQLLILSGKGGTGKTTVAGAFIRLSQSRAFADCDVDAPNLHLIMQNLPQSLTTDYYGLDKAVIDRDICIHCGLCEQHCSFGAIKDDTVDEPTCEGCGVCAEICPVHAVSMRAHVSGDLMLYAESDYVFSTAQLHIGSGASGKLVTAVKQQLAQQAPDTELTIIDGSPGIGCPVIASISGVDFVLIVTEPTVSGLHDMNRILQTASQFGVPCGVCINKYDINPVTADSIEHRCSSLSVPVVGRIPFDKTVVEAVNHCRSIAAYPDSPAGKAVKEIWEKISTLMNLEL